MDVSYNTYYTIPSFVELRCNMHSYMLCTIDVSYNTCNTIPSYCRIMMQHTLLPVIHDRCVLS